MRASVLFFSGAVLSLALSGCQSGGSGDASQTGGSGGQQESHGSADPSAGTTGMGGTTSNGGSAGSSATTAKGGADSNGGNNSNGGNEATGGSAGNAGSSTDKGGSAGKGGPAGTGGGSIGKGGAADAGVTGSGGRQGTGGASGGDPIGAGGQTGGPKVDGGLVSGCVGGKEWPTANPAAAGPFEVAADKKVGPLAGALPDPIYGDEQQRFNVYRPKNLADSGYCHPILIWANGYTDNPEQNPPKCVTDSAANKWCGQYLPLMNHLASHGFVVVASLSTATGSGNPLPTIVGLDWILEQAEDSSSPYYHRLDTANIGQLGHSFGGMSTCMSASEPRYKALATVCGTRALSGVHTPMMFFCGGKDTTVACSGVKDVFLSVKDQPAFFINELNADHGSWVYQGAKGVSLSSLAAWFRVHLMGDTANRKYFYGSDCTFCTDSRVQVEQNSLMTQ